MKETPGKAYYDVFISHSSRTDPNLHELVDGLAGALELRGFKVFLDRKIFYGGEPIFPALEGAISNSRVGLLILTQRALKSGFVELERDAMHRRQQAGRMKIAVLKLDDSKVPSGICDQHLIVPITRNDLSTLADQVAAAVRLVLTCKGCS